jgi:hypothetical protein
VSRRVSLPGADELFRTTGGTALQASSPGTSRRQANADPPRVPAPSGESAPSGDADQGGDAPDAQPSSAEGGASASAEHSGREAVARQATVGDRRTAAAQGRPNGRQQPDAAAQAAQSGAARRRARAANRRPSGRERHDEKITVYVSAEELMDLEHARLVLRGEHGLAVDRGRIVREAVAVVLADLESRGDASILVRRLRGR